MDHLGNMKNNTARKNLVWAALIVTIPLVFAYFILGLNHWDLSVPLIYGNSDEIWQLILTKVLKDTHWVLYNPYLGAPEIASWHHNAAGQTSALHSLLMLPMSFFINDAIKLQQLYYLFNFPLICATTFIACRLLKIDRLPAYCVGLLFAFTAFRINYMFYAYISNYFMIPLATTAIIWVLIGKFEALLLPSPNTSIVQRLKSLAKDRHFFLGSVFIILTALSDGYFAFFTLLLLGFAFGIRLLFVGFKSPLVLIPAISWIFLTLATSVVLQVPLHSYANKHHDEFYPNGVIDSTLVKTPFEAEVYSTSLKMIVAPIAQHRIHTLGALGQNLIDTSDQSRAFKNYQAFVPLGTLPTLLLAIVFLLTASPLLRRKFDALHSMNVQTDTKPVFDALTSIAFFVFLCSIFGGLGTLIAMVFPTIRAYNRFPIFLILTLYIFAAYWFTHYLKNASALKKSGALGLLIALTIFGLYDQTPSDSFKGKEETRQRFIAERNFVSALESTLPKDSMVYQYPYSQYLKDNKYYGWGSFAHVRLYLHSKTIHWSNGGAKNSPADEWNDHLSKLPIEQQLVEIKAVGFKAFVIDETVIKDENLSRLKTKLQQLGYTLHEDTKSQLAYVSLDNPGYSIKYNPDYQSISQISISSLTELSLTQHPKLINFKALAVLLEKSPKLPQTFTSAEHPDVFLDGRALSRGEGNAPITPLSDIKGKLTCETLTQNNRTVLKFSLTNDSTFDWYLASGSMPLRVGLHILDQQGNQLAWDTGYRLPWPATIEQGTTQTTFVSVDDIPLPATLKKDQPLVGSFQFVQDGHAWFSNLICQAPIR